MSFLWFDYTFANFEMSLKTYVTSSYGRNIQRKTSKLQDIAKRSATSKNQWIFLERCVSHNIIPKSFRVRCPIRSARGEKLTRDYRMKLVILAKSETKNKYFMNCARFNKIREEVDSWWQLENREYRSEVLWESNLWNYRKRGTAPLLQLKTWSISILSRTQF